MNIETANILLQYRKKSGLSQEELASKIGVSRQAVSKWERAEASPDTDNLILLAKVYGVTLDELLTGDPEEILNRNKQDLEDNKTEENTQTDTGKESENNDTNEETKAKVVLFTSNREMEKDPRIDLCIDWEYKDLVQNHPVLYQLLIERIAIAYQNKYGFPMEK